VYTHSLMAFRLTLRQALKRLRSKGIAVTFRAVAIEAGVSRDFLYRNPDMRALVVDTRATTRSISAPTPRADDSNIIRLIRDRCAAELASCAAEVADLSRRLEAAHTEIHRLKRELRQTQPQAPRTLDRRGLTEANTAARQSR
jgi:Family of unknown function (DUF6262)